MAGSRESGGILGKGYRSQEEGGAGFLYKRKREQLDLKGGHGRSFNAQSDLKNYDRPTHEGN